MTEIVYIALKERVQVTDNIVCIKDVADVYTKRGETVRSVQSLPLFSFAVGSADRKKRRGLKQCRESRQIISMLRVVQRIQQEGSEVLVLPSGQQNCVVEYVGDKKPHRTWEFLKVALVCLICLAGGAFSVMAFHNDIALPRMFQKFYFIVTGRQSSGYTILEFAYSIGLGAGILIFYNHVGRRRISQDPTPIEVSMRTYEQDMNAAMVENWEREGKIIDVE